MTTAEPRGSGRVRGGGTAPAETHARVALVALIDAAISVEAVLLWAHGGEVGRILGLLILAAVLAAGVMRRSGLSFAVGFASHLSVLAMILLEAGWTSQPGLRHPDLWWAAPLGALALTGVVVMETRRRVVAMRQRIEAAADEARAAAAAAMAASDAKSAFLATVSHEIRTPLNGVLGMVRAMAQDALDPAQRHRLAVVKDQSETLLSLVNALLDLARIEAGRLDLEDGVVDFQEIGRAAQAAYTTLAAHKDIYFVLTVAPEARGRWRGDPTRVRQILYNFVSNALKFTDRGSVQVDLRHDGRQVVMSVADTGPGLTPVQLDRLFQKFVQAEASTARRFGGSGLGLAICRELAELMGGEVSARSVEGQGATFIARLPLQRLEDAPAAPADAPEPMFSRGGLRVLAADDNPVNRLVLKTLFEPLGVEPRLVADGAEAVAAFAEGAWDIVLMDVEMPVLGGPEATREIRAFEVRTGRKRTPVIALTANVMSRQAETYRAAGMDAVVSKPLELGRLLGAIETLLQAAETPQREAGAA